MTSQIFVWGYGAPHSPVLREHAKRTEAARQFAAGRGWDRTRAGAWAGELAAPISLSRALAALETTIRSESAVAGWGGRSARAASDGRRQEAGFRRDEKLEVRTAPEGVEGLLPGELLLWWARAAVGETESLRGLLTAGVAQARALRRQREALLQDAQAARSRSAPVLYLPPGGAEKRKEQRRMSPQRVRELEELLPRAEFETINSAVTCALELAGAGRLADGYTVLLSSLRHAEAAGREWRPWAGELVRIYRLALENYAARFGVALE